MSPLIESMQSPLIARSYGLASVTHSCSDTRVLGWA
jgi:hypothetical protein